jgi:hypothetical protein
MEHLYCLFLLQITDNLVLTWRQWIQGVQVAPLSCPLLQKIFEIDCEIFKIGKSLKLRVNFITLKDGRYFEEITKSDETHPKVERF